MNDCAVVCGGSAEQGMIVLESVVAEQTVNDCTGVSVGSAEQRMTVLESVVAAQSSK